MYIAGEEIVRYDMYIYVHAYTHKHSRVVSGDKKGRGSDEERANTQKKKAAKKKREASAKEKPPPPEEY